MNTHRLFLVLMKQSHGRFLASEAPNSATPEG